MIIKTEFSCKDTQPFDVPGGKFANYFDNILTITKGIVPHETADGFAENAREEFTMIDLGMAGLIGKCLLITAKRIKSGIESEESFLLSGRTWILNDNGKTVEKIFDPSFPDKY